MSQPEKLTDEQIKLCFIAALGMEPRRADVEIVKMTGGDVTATAEYIWDHWMGEPKEPSVVAVTAHLMNMLAQEAEHAASTTDPMETLPLWHNDHFDLPSGQCPREAQ